MYQRVLVTSCPYSKKREGVREECGNEEKEEQEEDEGMRNWRSKRVVFTRWG